MKNRRHHIKNKVRILKTKKPFFKKLIFWIIFFSLIAIMSFLYVFLFFSKTQVNSVLINGNNSVQNKDIENIAWNNINSNISKSIFLVKPKNISKDILNKFPQIEIANVSIKFPQTVNLQIKERIDFAVFCTDYLKNKECFNIDQNGIIFKVLEKIPENNAILIKPLDDREFFIGEKVLEENIMETISQIRMALKDNFKIDIKEAVILDTRLNIKTSENWQIYFNLDSQADLQIEKMNLLLKNEIPVSARNSLQYIDLRFKDRAYYK